MIPSNLHTHSTFSDGANPPEEYVKAAIKSGFFSIGFSEHEPTTYKNPSEMLPENIPAYFNEINRLKQKYTGQIEIYAGIETDVQGLLPRAEFKPDYIIGSVHHIKKPDGTYGPLDATPEKFETLIDAFGDVKKVMQLYYQSLADTIKQKPDILGHFDLPTKFNSGNRYFDPAEEWYKNLIDSTINSLTNTGIIVEVNTGAISRRYRKTPYPSEYILRELHKKNVTVTISSDAHSIENLTHSFTQSAALIRQAGYKSIKILKNGRFTDYKLDR